jgi:hypothetical protein
MAVASHFIDLSDGDVKVLPPDAKNLILVMDEMGTGTIKLVSCGNSGFDSDESISQTIGAQLTAISAVQLLHIKVTATTTLPTTIKLYYGV